MTDFEKRVYEAVRQIPYGQVRTYGDIAFAIGSPNACRAVGNALHKNPSLKNAPCHRVVNSKMQLAKAYVFGGEDVQRQLLEAEGVKVDGNRVVATDQK